jgi:hypothetical protein
MGELDGLKVYGETQVGWCAFTPPNETVDEFGNPSIQELGFTAADPRAPARRIYDDPAVSDLREYLRRHNGMHGLEICAPGEIDRAARIFHRDGFVVVRDLLGRDHLDRFRAGCARVLKEILEIPGAGRRKYMTETGRLPHRYSYGTSSASRQLLHDPVWSSMIDLPTTTPLLTRIFGSEAYRVIGAGGDLCLPGAIEYQALHSGGVESFELPDSRIQQAERMGIELRNREDSTELDLRTRQLIIDRTPPIVTINFLMSDLTWENGPIRQIPGTQGRAGRPPLPGEEPEWMRLCTLVGAPAGAGIFRDNRAWHGGTPNLGREIRAMPNVEYGAPWIPEHRFKRTMPHDIWLTLSPHARQLCRLVKTEPDEWPAGAGVMHPLSSKRDAAKQRGSNR